MLLEYQNYHGAPYSSGGNNKGQIIDIKDQINKRNKDKIISHIPDYGLWNIYSCYKFHEFEAAFTEGCQMCSATLSYEEDFLLCGAENLGVCKNCYEHIGDEKCQSNSQ